jgi:PAS domain S-box-containing protein
MTAPTPHLEKPSILIVDDNARNIHLLRDILCSEGGFAIAATTGGEEAIELARRNRPDLILLDVKMPQMNGYDVCEALKSRPETAAIPVVFLTARKTDPEDVAKGFAVGGADYLTKPFHELELLARVRTQLRLKFSHEAYQALVDHSQQGMIILQQGRCRFANPKIAEITGYPVEKLTAMTAAELRRLIHPEDRASAWGHYQRRLNGQPAPENYPLRLIHAEGGVVGVNVLSVPMKFQGKPSIQATLTDATRLWDLEALLGRRTAYQGMIGAGRPMQRVYTLIEQLADSDLPVLLTGETGTGKELAAEAIHAAGARRDRSMLRVNCAAFPENLIEAELFGYKKGAYTGAEVSKPGLFCRADGGTLFLDEIGELPLHLQPKLLRVLDRGEFQPLGALSAQQANVRIISATNLDLAREAADGRFRRDLYFRLRCGHIHLPPLRERKSDIPALFQHFLDEFARRNGRTAPRAGEALIEAFRRNPWPGNVRELKNVAEFALSVCEGPVLDLSTLPEEILGGASGLAAADPGASVSNAAGRNPPGAPPSSPQPEQPQESCGDPEKNRILTALKNNQWHKSRTARELGMARSTLYRKLAEWDAEPNSAE